MIRMCNRFLVLALLLGIGTLAWGVTYTVTDLGTLGGDRTWARGINDAGQVVGSGDSQSSDRHHAFLWEDGEMTDLGLVENGLDSWGTAVNNSGVVVGGGSTTQAGTINKVFLYDEDNGLRVMEGGFGQFDTRYASAINSSGQVCGSWGDNGYIWDNGQMVIIEPISGQRACIVSGMNDEGDVVGRFENGRYGYVYNEDDGVVILSDLFGPNGGHSTPVDINNHGHIVGHASGDPQGQRPVLWVDGVIQDIGTLEGSDGWANAINDKDQIVGYAYLAPSSYYQATLWEEGEVFNLNDLIPEDSGWLLRVANDINESGMIVGWGDVGDEERAFLLTPIPEPATISLAAIAFLSFAGRLHRRRRQQM